MSASAFSVRHHTYVDSVQLMRIARSLESCRGVVQVAALMATPANKELFHQAGFSGEAIDSAGSDDLVVGVEAATEVDAGAAVASLEELLNPSGSPAEAAPTDLSGALARLPNANLVSISTPGEFAAAEIEEALSRGLHVFCFSSNVALDDEIRLKELARERGLLLMGPDCGTAIIAGVGLGFSNIVRRGPVGIVGASGSGSQEISCLVHAGGSGISHLLGTGGRDLTDAVGGVTAVAALQALMADPDTQIVVIVAKAPGELMVRRLAEEIAAAPKPVVTCYLGRKVPGAKASLEEAATEALRIVGGSLHLEEFPSHERRRSIEGEVLGLFAGGSLKVEAEGLFEGRAELIDMGSEEFTRGRPHPMIDASLRKERIVKAGQDPRVGALLLDVVLGIGAASDPAGDLAPSIMAARGQASKQGRELVVIASVVGTPEDPQGLEAQRQKLRDAGAEVFETSLRAAMAARELLP